MVGAPQHALALQRGEDCSEKTRLELGMTVCSTYDGLTTNNSKGGETSGWSVSC